MRKGLLIALAGLVLLVFAALTVTTQSLFYAITAMSGLCTTFIPLCAPFVLLQLALCRFCPWRPLFCPAWACCGAGGIWSKPAAGTPFWPWW